MFGFKANDKKKKKKKNGKWFDGWLLMTETISTFWRKKEIKRKKFLISFLCSSGRGCSRRRQERTIWLECMYRLVFFLPHGAVQQPQRSMGSSFENWFMDEFSFLFSTRFNQLTHTHTQKGWKTLCKWNARACVAPMWNAAKSSSFLNLFFFFLLLPLLCPVHFEMQIHSNNNRETGEIERDTL